MTSRHLIQGLSIALVTAMIGLGQACQGPHSTSTGNPSTSPTDAVALRIQAFNGMVGSNSLSVMKMCLTRLRFNTASGSGDSGDIELNLGEVNVTTAGADLSNVQIPPGTYSRVEFDLENGCGTGESLSVTNNSGTFATTDNMTIGFDGTLTVTGTQTVNLLIQQVVDALASVNNGSNLKDAAESVSGGCD